MNEGCPSSPASLPAPGTDCSCNCLFIEALQLSQLTGTICFLSKSDVRLGVFFQGWCLYVLLVICAFQRFCPQDSGWGCWEPEVRTLLEKQLFKLDVGVRRVVKSFRGLQHSLFKQSSQIELYTGLQCRKQENRGLFGWKGPQGTCP